MTQKDASAPSRRALVSLGGGVVGALTSISAAQSRTQMDSARAPPGPAAENFAPELPALRRKADKAANLADLQDPVEALANIDLHPAGVGAVARSVALVLNDWSNSVMNYGAAGDGVSDDTQAFVHALAAYAGRQVFVPPDRIYRVGAVGGLGPAGAGVVGVAGYNTVIKPTQGFKGSIFYNPHAGSIGSAYGVLRDLRFDLDGQDCVAIDLSHCDTFVVDRVNGRGHTSRANAAGSLVKFGAPSNSSSYNNVVRDCGAENFATAVVFGKNANQNRLEGGTYTNNRIAVDCAPGGTLARPQILGARIESNDIGVLEGAQGGIYLGYFEAHAIGDFSFTAHSDAAVILPGTTTAVTVTPLHNHGRASNLRCLSFDMGYYDQESSESRTAFEQRRQVRTLPGAAVDPPYPAGDFTDLFLGSPWLGNDVSLEAVNRGNDGTLILMKANAADELEIAGYDRKRRAYRDVNIGGGGSVNPLASGVTSLGKDERRFKTAHLSEGVRVGGRQVLGAQRSAIPDAQSPVDAVARVNAVLACLRAHGLIAT